MSVHQRFCLSLARRGEAPPRFENWNKWFGGGVSLGANFVMRFVRASFLLVIVLAARALFAQTSVPMLLQPVPAQTLSPGGPAVTLDVRNYIGVPGVVGTQFAVFETVLGRFSVELRNDVAPRHAANFLNYIRAGAYTNSFIHRAASFENGPVSIVQGGGYAYRLPFQVAEVSRLAPVALEYNLTNARGTLAAARTTDINSATSEWFFNTRDNSTILNQSNGGGYSVFGRVLGTGMTVVDAIAAIMRYNAGAPFNEIPLRNYTSGNPTESNLIVITAVREATLFPTGGGTSVLELTVQNSAPSVVATTLSGSTLTITPTGSGTANITVRAVDTNGNVAEGSFVVSIAGGPPVLTAQPVSQTVAAGSTVVFNAPSTGAAEFTWERNGVEVPGATSSTLVIGNASAANSGNYVHVASNAMGTVRSTPATLSVSSVAAADIGRLVNLSILTTAGSGSRVLTMGAFVGPGGSSGGLPIVIRAVGPTLAQPPFNVGGVLPDPVMTFYAAGNSTPIETNDNWGGAPALSEAFQNVAAFALPAGSLDSALVRTSPAVSPGGYTVQVTGKGDASGVVIAEIYDASGLVRSPTSPRLINLSTRAEIDNGADLAVGFVLGGQSARTVLVRGVGPSLTQFGLTGLMVDPRLELFNNSTGQRIAGNDDWAGSLEIATAAAAVGAFPLVGGTSKDAVLLVTLPPGPYSARINGANGAGGAAIVEVYEVP
jgi:cyclophilin family peptidyl-prolyl cis-trans isomerase